MAARKLSASELAQWVRDTLGGLSGELDLAGVSPATLEHIRIARKLALAELAEDKTARAAEIDALATTLTPPEAIRYAEQLIRSAYPVLSPLYGIWGTIADEMNSVSHLPELTVQRPRDTRQFNHFQGLAWQVIDQLHGRVP